MILPLLFSRAAKASGRKTKSSKKSGGGLESITKNAMSSGIRALADISGASNVPIISKILDGYERIEELRREAEEERREAEEQQLMVLAKEEEQKAKKKAKEDKQITAKADKLRKKKTTKKTSTPVSRKDTEDYDETESSPRIERSEEKKTSSIFERVRGFRHRGGKSAVERNRRSHALAVGNKVSDADKVMKTMSKDVKIIKDYVVEGDRDKLKQGGGFGKSLMGMMLGKRLLGGAGGAAVGAMGGGAGVMEIAALLAGGKGLAMIPKALGGMGRGLGSLGAKVLSKAGAVTGITALAGKAGLAEKIAPVAAKAGGLVGKIGGKIGALGKLGLGMAAGTAAIAPTALSTVPTAASAGGAVAGVAGKSAAAKVGVSAAKGIGKSLIKKLPLIGLLAGVGFGIKRAIAGDYSGAGLEVASGLASTVPGLGTAGSIAIDAGLAARDIAREGSTSEGVVTQATAPHLESVVPEPSIKSDRLAETETEDKFSEISENLSTMLSLMLNERGGIYVRPAIDPLKEKMLDLGMLSGETMAKDMKALQEVTKPTRNYGEQKFTLGESLQGLTPEETAALANNTALTESSGNIKAQNKFGYMGKYQMGADALVDTSLVKRQAYEEARKASGKNWFKGGQEEFLNNEKNWNIEGGKKAFMSDEKLQDRAYFDYTSKNITRGFSSGALNQSSKSADIAAYAKVAHLKGAGGANDYFNSGIDSTDANGTRASDYAKQARLAINDSLVSQTQKAIDSNVKYGFGSKNVASGQIDCSGWIANINKNLIDGMAGEGEKLTNSQAAKKMFEGGSAEIVDRLAATTGQVLTNKDLTADSLKEGMIIGENNGAKHGRGKYGVDHITQVVRDPKTGQLMISQSSSGKGVNMEKADSYLARKNKKGTKLFGVDTSAALDKVTGGEYSNKLSSLKNDSPRLGDAMNIISTEKKNAETQVASAPIIISNQSQATPQANTGSPAAAGMKAPLFARNNDSTIQRLTMNYLSNSV